MDYLSNLLAAIAGLLGLVLLHLWRRLTKSRSYRTNSGRLLAPEVPGRLPIIGHLHQLGAQKTLFRTLADMADKNGPIFTIYLGNTPVLVISNYDAVKECFTANDKSLAARPKSSHGIYLGYNYAGFGFANYGTYWREMRKLVMIELLSGRRLETLKHVQISEIENFVKDLYGVCKSNGFFPTKVLMSRWIEHLTLNIITEMVAGKKYFESSDGGKNRGGGDTEAEAERIGKIIKDFMAVSGAPVISDMVPVPKWIDLAFGKLGVMKRIGKDLDRLMQSWIEEHKHKIKTHGSTSNKQDFIDVMLSVIEDDSMFGFSRETIIKATVVNLIIAGSDTTAITLIWIISLLLNNKHVLKRAQEEIDEVVGKERWVEDCDIKDLVYLQAIVKETLRLYPPGPLAVPHEAMEDCEVCGYEVEKGLRVFVNLWKLHRDPSFWDDPHAFMPERFVTRHAGLDASGLHYEFIPFGSGRRSCPGMNLALQVSHLALGRLLQGFELSTPLDGVEVDMSEGTGVTLPKITPLELVLTPRLPHHLY